MKILINKIVPFTAEIFDPNNNSLGFATEYEFYDLRIQIKENQVSGYYVMFKDRKILIDKDGGVDIWPEGFFDQTTNLLSRLL